MKRIKQRVPRLFLGEPLGEGLLRLNDYQTHYLRRVLRLRSGDSLVLFNGRGEERHAVVETLAREGSTLLLAQAKEPLPESPLALSLIQGIAKSEAMDLIIQKSTELGVHAIYPVLTDFCVVKLDEARASRRTEHWQKIAQGACEQSHRHRPPTIHRPQKLPDGLVRVTSDETRITLQPGSPETFSSFRSSEDAVTQLCILIGPEGGLSPTDLEQADLAGFRRVSLGPRILRTETAAMAACTLAQALWGDLVG